MEFKRSFSLYQAYDFLKANGFEKECEEIKNSSDQFQTYTSTLRRAKIIALLRDNKLLNDFCDQVWPSGLTDKGKSRIRFYENLIVRFQGDEDGSITEDEEDESATEENEVIWANNEISLLSG
jgi:hypothetical protein